MILLRELNDTFDLPLWKLEEILHELVSQAEITDEIINQSLIRLSDAAKLDYTRPNLGENHGDDDFELEDLSSSHKIQCEEIDLDDEDDAILNRALEKWRERRNMEESQKTKPIKVEIINKPQVIANRKCFEYVKSHIYLPLNEPEFCNIETGFRLIWDYAEGQMLGDYDCRRAVDQYLTSIESSIDREKMAKVVDLMLEYQTEIGEWGENNEV